MEQDELDPFSCSCLFLQAIQRAADDRLLTSDHDTVIRYSVLCFDQEGDAYYAERKSPPRIIIPPG